MSTDKKDRVFSHAMENIKPFEFNEGVAGVFDDMAKRSIPFYTEVQRMVCELALTFYQAESTIYDLGCSTGTTIATLASSLKENNPEARLVGFDTSEAMCTESRNRMEDLNVSDMVSIRQQDVFDAKFENASVVIMNYTLQFIDPLKREKIIKHIYDSLNHNGILLVSDKMLQTNTDTSRIFIDAYYDLKRRNGYSEMEISQKREALDNVLIPYHLDEELDLFKRCGFEKTDIFFSWYNFTSFLSIKR